MKKIFLTALLLVGFCGCATTGLKGPPLKVGISPNYPPLIFTQDGDLAGIEYDLMRKLARELDRPVTVVSMPWEEQIDALIAGKIDIIMSGMSVTKARQVKIAFSDSWMNGGLGVLMHPSQEGRVTTVEAVKQFNGTIGVIPGTTAQDYVLRNCKNARVVKIASAADAGIQIQRRTVDLFIHDIPSVAWQAATFGDELRLLMEPIDREQIAWGLRRDDTELMSQVNEKLAEWKADGSLDAIILKWIPYYNRIK